MSEEYEYERVEIKPGDQSWVGRELFVDTCGIKNSPKEALKVLSVGERMVFIRSDDGLVEGTIWLGKDFYIRKPKRKMVKVARCLFKMKNKNDGWVYESNILGTEEQLKKAYADTLVKWPYGEIIEVEEGE